MSITPFLPLICLTLTAGEVRLQRWTNSIGIVFIHLPSARTMPDLWFGMTEITQAQWSKIMHTNPSQFKGETRPVESVSWIDATNFCLMLRNSDGHVYRLPSEKEWEYACRASQKPRGLRDINEYAWTLSNASNTMRVAQLRPNAWGLFDMQGNVWEWCADPCAGPTPDGSLSHRVLKGGAFFYSPTFTDPAERLCIAGAGEAEVRASIYGFRIVCENPVTSGGHLNRASSKALLSHKQRADP